MEKIEKIGKIKRINLIGVKDNYSYFELIIDREKYIYKLEISKQFEYDCFDIVYFSFEEYGNKKEINYLKKYNFDVKYCLTLDCKLINDFEKEKKEKFEEYLKNEIKNDKLFYLLKLYLKTVNKKTEKENEEFYKTINLFNCPHFYYDFNHKKFKNKSYKIKEEDYIKTEENIEIKNYFFWKKVIKTKEEVFNFEPELQYKFAKLLIEIKYR